MGDSSSWIVRFLKVVGNFRIGISTASKSFVLHYHAVSQDQIDHKIFPVIERKLHL